MSENKKNVKIDSLNIIVSELPFQVFSTVSGTFDGINVYIGGGPDPHIGAVAISTPRPSLKDSEKLSCTTSIYNCIGHKDDVIAKKFSEALCLRYNCVTVVSAGIHLDNITPAGIQQFQQLSAELLDKVIRGLDDIKDDHV
ncbi:MAG: hypothetical protein ACOX5F_09740 [Anaerovoracaceae bacterium]|jgi:hypothetical protein